MDSSPTLHDFVLNLIYDADARAAFESDPEGTLHAAGLGDVTAADVQEVIPLVVDYVPMSGITSAAGPAGVPDLPTGIADLDVAGAAAQLQSITSQLTVVAPPSADVSLANAGAVVVTSDGAFPGVPGVGVGFENLGAVQTGGDSLLSVTHDPGVGLDAGLTTVTGPASTTVSDADGLVAHTGVDLSATLDGTAHVITDVSTSVNLHDPLNLDEAGLHPAVSSVLGSATGSGSLDGVSSDGGHLHGALGDVSDVTSTVSGLTHHSAPDAIHDPLGAVTDLHF
jgi:hypothetical protein